MKLPDVIPAKLGQYARCRKLVAALRGLAESLLVFGVGLVLVALVESVCKPQLLLRIWLSGANYFLAGTWLIVRAAAPLLRFQTLRQTARTFETAANGRFQERILSAVEMAQSHEQSGQQRGVSAWMASKTISLAADDISAVNPKSLIDSVPARRAWKKTAGLILILALACLIPGVAERARLALHPFASTAVLSTTKLVITPGNCRIKQGAPLQIKATASAPQEQAKALIRWDDGFQETVTMSGSETNGFALDLAGVTQGFRYSVQAGDAESLVFTVKVDVPPRIARMQLLILPPPYTGWTNRVVEGGSAEFLSGSQVRIVVETAGEKIASAEWTAEGFSTRTLSPAGDNGLVLDLQPTNALTYQIRLTGMNQLQTDAPTKWTLRPILDEPPTARLVATGVESGMVQRDEVLPLQVQAADDVGIKHVELVILNKESEAAVTSIYKKEGTALNSREVKSAINLNLADLVLVSGDEAQFQLAVTDLRDQTTRSEPISVVVGSMEKSLEAHAAARLKLMIAAMEAQIDYLKQTRTSWLSIGRNYKEDDSESQRPALTLLKSRLNEFAREVALVGERLISDSETNRVSEARYMYRLGSTVSVWGQQQRDVLLENCALLDHTTNAFETFNQGRELFSRALIDLEQYKRAMVVLEGVFETDVLAVRCESAQGRYKRGLPILRGESNSNAPTGSGLLATFFEDTELRGKVLEQRIANPHLENDGPGNRKEQYSVRYEGDLNITEPGEWTLGCIVDDGVRLLVDGKSILPQQAWGAHGATQFKADLGLTAGWHPIVIEFFQGSSLCKLQFLYAKKGQPLQEVPTYLLRPPSARQPQPQVAATAALSSAVKDAAKERVKSSFSNSASAPPALVPLAAELQIENLTRIVKEKLPVSESLSSNLVSFSVWKLEDTVQCESQADQLTAFSREAQRILREELDRYRWRYEGSAALKKIQNAITEVREINNDLRQLPHNPTNKRSEQEQAKNALAKAWEAQLQKAAAEASHNFFETAKQKDATLAERALALNASTKVAKELQPAIEKLAKTLEENRNKDDMAGQVEQRLNEINDRYREINDLQERMNYEHVAAEARKALPQVRAFERAQKAGGTSELSAKFDKMKQAVAEVQKAQRVANDVQGAEKLESLSGQSAETAKGKETADEVRGLAMRTDNNPPSLSQTIPPPMQQQTEALEKHKSTAHQSAEQLSKPRLAMALEAARLNRQGDRKAAVAYDMLGQDTGELLDSPASLSAQTLKPLAERAAALAGQKGEEARQAEIKAANERMALMARNSPANQEALAARLDELSAMSKQAAGDASKQKPLTAQLGETSQLAQPVGNWPDSTDAKEIAASAAKDSLTGIEAAPKSWESFNEASQILADAARQIRMDAAVDQLGDLNPYPSPSIDTPSEAETAMPSQQDKTKMEGAVGKAITQPPPKGIDEAEWARLNERLRQAIRNSGIENFSEEQQAAIRAYFERLSSDK